MKSKLSTGRRQREVLRRKKSLRKGSIQLSGERGAVPISKKGGRRCSAALQGTDEHGRRRWPASLDMFQKGGVRCKAENEERKLEGWPLKREREETRSQSTPGRPG